MEQIVHKEPRKLTAMTEDAVHYPSTSKYTVKRMYDDLLIFSFKHLKIGGRIVFWFPVNREDYSEKLLPQHTALELVANSEQKLTADAMRRLLTYEKVRETGELVNVAELEEINFRKKYLFTDDEKKDERRIAAQKRHQHNVAEAKKRGVTLQSRTEKKRDTNKKMMMDREAARE
jgi:tRNA (guanine10-N2)-methyltransferase